MAELSSNWKKLQATLSDRKQAKATTTKRKADDRPLHSVGVRKASNKKPGKLHHYTKVSDSLNEMGGVHSSTMMYDASGNEIPSLGLWTRKDSTSSESIADVYGLGIKDIPLFMGSHNDRVNHGRSLDVDVGKYVAVDCEMVGVGPRGYTSALARVSMVDFHGRQVYDSYVKATEPVTDWRTRFSGVSPKEMRFARDFVDVQKDVSKIIQGRILVGHDVNHDLEVLKLSHPPKYIRDTAKHAAFKKFGHGRKPALRRLARELLGIDIQTDSHSSTEDARATMLLFRKDKSNFDIQHANRYPKAKKPGRRLKKRKQRR